MSLTCISRAAGVSGQIARNCFSQFFTNGNNHLSRFVKTSRGLDKTAKLGKAVAEMTQGILQETGGSESAVKTAKNIVDCTKVTRDVMGLGNVVGGVIPNIIRNARKCCLLMRQSFSARAEFDPSNKELSPNALYTKSDFRLAAAKTVCDLISGTTFAVTFGGLKPTLLANKVAGNPFLSSEAKASLGTGISILMTANHAAGVVGGGLSIIRERRAYQRCLERLNQKEVGQEKSGSAQEVQAMRSSYVKRLRNIILTIIEKALELVADFLKLIPWPMSAACNLACVGAITTASSSLALWKVWQSTGSSS
ncbi:CT529 family inclusion membrane protein [Chlamydia pecorum]|uniref:CT529 family inclusion membrane protein n=1 Tax=Chlamydia pecorum TaxID=85991 RepID=UPI003524973D